MKTQNSKSANLTQNEQEVLKALVLNAQAEGDSGTEFLIDEVAAALNKSEKSVAATVGELQKKGLVDCYAKGYYFNGAVTEKGMAEFDKIEKTAKKSTKKETIERNLKTAKEFQDAIKDCKSEAAQEYKKQAQATIEHYEAELAKENKVDSKPEAPQAEVGNEPEKKVAKTARKVGDHHPTQPWIWKEYQPGKFDWRKDPNAPKAAKSTPTPKAKKSLGVDWDYYDAPRFDKINEKYLAAMGEGDNMASQIVAAVNKLVYKWYNDGDVYDNQHGMEGWANDLSSYANWLAKNAAGAKVVLDQIFDCYHKHVYEHILKELADLTMRMSYLKNYEKLPKTGSIYDCDGDYEFSEESGYDDEEEEW